LFYRWQYVIPVISWLMWSFVAQNFYISTPIKTRRSVALKKLHWSSIYPVLVKHNTTQYWFKSRLSFNDYFNLYCYLFKKSFWSLYSNLTYKNQGMLYNNLTLSYYYITIDRLRFSKVSYITGGSLIKSYSHSDPYNLLLLPFVKTTFNSLVLLSYYLLTSYYITHPLWFKLVHTYTWLDRFFKFDVMLNTFYFKTYNY